MDLIQSLCQYVFDKFHTELDIFICGNIAVNILNLDSMATNELSEKQNHCLFNVFFTL